MYVVTMLAEMQGKKHNVRCPKHFVGDPIATEINHRGIRTIILFPVNFLFSIQND